MCNRAHTAFNSQSFVYKIMNMQISSNSQSSIKRTEKNEGARNETPHGALSELSDVGGI